MPDVSDLRCSPAWFPLGAPAAAGGAVLLLQLDEPAYRAASFLDERLLGAAQARRTCAPELLAEAAATLRPRAHFLFHIGHVGSTLMSRLLGEHPEVFALREPGLLRGLADARLGPRPLRLHPLLGLLTRTWDPRQRALIKTTSLVNELAGELLQADPTARALLMFARPAEYLRGILAGANSRRESAALAALRWERLLRRLDDGRGAALGGRDPPLPAPRGEGEQVAMSWLCEMLTLRQTAKAQGGRMHWVDFDAFLRSPEPVLRRILEVLGLQTTPPQLRALLASPWMQRYSKAPEHAYDAELRRQVLAAADAEHGAEIRRGLDWLQRAARRADLAALFT